MLKLLLLLIFDSILKIVTRGITSTVSRLGITLYPKVKIERCKDFERFLLVGPQNVSVAKNQIRRSVPVTLKKCKDVPIGARGRKRKTLMFIGINANPDGRRFLQPPASASRTPMVQPATPNLNVRQLTPASASRAPMVQPATPESSSFQPAKRTYARASSTPFPTGTINHRPRVVSFPLLDDSPVAPVGNVTDTSLEVNFDDTFGCLHYDSSESD